MTQLEGGDFEEGVRRANRVLAVRGQVLPAAATPLTMHARTRDGTVIDGQSLITRTAGIEQAWVTPSDAPASEDALVAIAEADLIILGPGSLYTSLFPSLLLPEIRDAIVAAPAVRVFVCNVATQVGETAGLDLAGHVEALVAHAGAGIVDTVLANNRLITPLPPEQPAEPVRLTWPPNLANAPRLILDDVVDPDHPHHHDPVRLASAVIHVWEREGGARRRAMAARSA